MPRALRILALLVGKDLRIEARTRQTLGLVLVLGVLIVVVLGLGLGTNLKGYQSTSILWVAYLFSGVICFEKTMSVERNDGVLAALLGAPVDAGILYLAKLCSNLILMAATTVVITMASVLFLNFDLSVAPFSFILVMFLSMVGFAAVGTLFAAVVSSTRLAGGLLAVLVFPISLPLVITSTQILVHRFRDNTALEAGSLGILFAFDAIFIAVSWAVYELVLEP